MLRSTLMTNYADVAKAYDSHYQRPIDLAENRILHRHLQDLVCGETVYDLGCGTGLLLDLGLWPAKYVGIDPCSPMIDVLRSKFPHVAGVVGHAEAPTSWWAAQGRAGQPTVITALFSANYLDLLATATLAYGHLSNDGRLFLHGAGPRYVKRKNYILQDDDPSFATWTPRKIRAALNDAGFTDIRFKRVNGLPDWISSRLPTSILTSAIYLAAQLLPIRAHYHFAVTARRP